MDFEKAKSYILKRLENETRKEFTYHNILHTLDVFDAVVRIAQQENIEGRDLILLKTAALYHDAGMLRAYKGHEEVSIEIINEILPKFNYSKEEIDIIGKTIMTTQLPQTAKNHLEKTLCDADLDYLGRDDFFTISHCLRLEWERLDVQHMSLLEWYLSQIVFLSEHTYFTKTSISTREKGKQDNLKQINDLLNHNE